MPGYMQVGLLGGLKLVLDGAPITGVNTARLQALLAYLLLNRAAPQGRQHIAFLFWPDSSEEQALSNLRNLILNLRRALPDCDRFIGVDRHALQWRASDPGTFTFDVADFETALAAVNGSPASASDHYAGGPADIRALRNTVDLYTGDLLPGCYDEWITAPRERLRQGFLEALQHLVRSLEAANDLNAAILYARRLLRHDPFQEENYRWLMRLHMANGDHAAAISVYRSCEALLRREMGVEPSPATRELRVRVEEALRSHDGAKPGERQTRRDRKVAARSGSGQEAEFVPNNLLASTTSFIGREREVSSLSDLLCEPGVRLVTLTGSPGTGKTRLAQQTAAGLAALPFDSAHPFRDGVYFVPLSSVPADGSVASAIARTLGIEETGRVPVRQALLERLRGKSLLVLLDNFEHLLPQAGVVSDLLSACPRLRVLVTSRATLNLQGEHEFEVPAMPVPGRDAPTQPDELAQFESVALFLARALEVSPRFSLTRDNARVVAEICRKLEGVPLAIELAAVRVKVLSPEGILSRLDRRLRLLVGGRSDLPPRQHALATAIAWSYNLLSQGEQELFRKLSVFSGGCTLEAAQSVAGAGDVLEGMTILVNRSLLQQVASGLLESPPRFRMLETIKEYASEQLEAHSETAPARSAHAAYFLALAEQAQYEIIGPNQIAWLDLLDAEHDNIREALRRALDTGDADTALRIAGALARFWERRGHRTEGRAWTAEALSLEAAHPRTALRAKALYSLSYLAARQGDYNHARQAAEEALTIARDLGDRAGIALSLNALGLVATDQADYGNAVALLEESLELFKESGNTWGIANCAQSLGLIAYYLSDLDRASSLIDENLPRWRQTGDKWGIAASLRLMANINDDRQEFERARAIYRESLTIYRETGNKWGVAWTLHDLGDIAWRFGSYDEAEPLHRENLSIFEEIGDKTGIAMSLHRLGRIAFDRGEYDSAASLYRRSLDVAVELGNKPVIGFAVGGLAAVAAARGDSRLAAYLFGAAQALLDTVGSSLDSVGVARALPALRAGLGEEGWQAAWSEGKSMPLDKITATARLVT